MALVVVLFCVPLFAGLDGQDLDNDEAIYSFSVDVMLKSGDWLTPKSIPSETSAFLEKPPLKFWIVGLPIHWGLLPANEYGMRFWDAVMGSVAFLYIFAIGRRLAGPLCGFTAVLLLFSHGPLVFQHGLRTNNMEASVFLAYAAGMYHFLAWRSSGPDSRGHIFAIALYFVLGFMTKFVAALFLPAILGIAVLLKAEDRLRLRMQWLTFVLAGLLAAALIAPWFVYEYIARGPRLFSIMFGAHVVKRFTAYLDPTHLHPWHFYITELWRQLQASGSRILVVPGAALIVVRVLRRRWLEGALLILWFAFPIGLISTGTSKLYHYAYPFLPPVALAGGYAMARIAEWTWRVFKRPTEALADFRVRKAPAVLRAAWIHWFLTVFGILALGVAVATGVLGRVRVAAGDIVLFRNTSILRPAIAGTLAVMVGAPAVVLRVILTFAVALGVMPISAYEVSLARTQMIERPLHDLRACWSPIVARIVAEGRNPPGAWIESRSFSHTYNYYLRSLGPLEQRDSASDATDVANLFAPAAYRPVLLSRERYSEFTARLGQNDSRLLAQAAAKAEVGMEALAESIHDSELGIFDFGSEVLLLPGPYAGCVPEHIRMGSR